VSITTVVSQASDEESLGRIPSSSSMSQVVECFPSIPPAWSSHGVTSTAILPVDLGGCCLPERGKSLRSGPWIGGICEPVAADLGSPWTTGRAWNERGQRWRQCRAEPNLLVKSGNGTPATVNDDFPFPKTPLSPVGIWMRSATQRSKGVSR